MQNIASILHNEDFGGRYAVIETEITESLRRHYEDNGQWCSSVQGADAWALWVGLGSCETAASLAQRYDASGCFDTGFLGTDILLEVLLSNGYADTAFSLLESEKPGSFLYMKHRGATTLWERWTGEESHDHPMFGACVRHLFTYFLGIRQEAAGYIQLLISPQIPASLAWAEGSLLLQKGRVFVRWEQSSNHVRFNISIPEGQTARFIFGTHEQLLASGDHTLTYPIEKQCD